MKGVIMLEDLKRKVCEANMELPKNGLVSLTYGNVSGIDRKTGMFVIKPSGVPYDKLTPAQMIVMDLEGNKVEGIYQPSSDTAIHTILYRAFPLVGGITHTRSIFATSFAQAGREIPCLGTTHADYILGNVPCFDVFEQNMTPQSYVDSVGSKIAEHYVDKDYMDTPAILCKGHGPFTWGRDAREAVSTAIVLEDIAQMAMLTMQLNENTQVLSSDVQQMIFSLRHGDSAHYGQKHNSIV